MGMTEGLDLECQCGAKPGISVPDETLKWYSVFCFECGSCTLPWGTLEEAAKDWRDGLRTPSAGKGYIK